jgi:hypothetical protein
VEALARLSPLADEALTMGHQDAQLAHWWGRHPDGRDESGRKYPRQMERVTGIGLHACRTNELDQERMGNLHLLDQWGKLVIQRPSIGRRFQHHLISLCQVCERPLPEALEAQLAWGEHDLLSGIDRRHHDVVLVDVQRDKPFAGGHGRSLLRTSRERNKPGGLECVVVGR